MVGEAAAPSPAAELITWLWLPRRSGSQASSVAWWRSATKASCSSARQRAWAWTSPVATQRSPSRRASAASARLRARSWRAYGRCSSTYRRSGPNASSSRRRSSSSPVAARRAERRARGAAGQADEPLGVVEHRLHVHRRPPSSRRRGSRVWAWASVRIRQRLRQPRSSRTSSVRWREGPLAAEDVDLGAVDRPHPVLGARPGPAPSSRETELWSVSASAR